MLNGQGEAEGGAVSLLMLTRYEALGASSRVRMFSYVPWLLRRGFKIDVQGLLPNEYLRRKYDGRAESASQIARAYVSRLQFLLTRREWGVIWVEKELWPFIPFAVERLFLARHRYVIDIDDAVFHSYDRHRSLAVRHILGRKVDSIFRGSSLVIAGSDYLARRANEAGAPWVEVLPTAVDLDRYGASKRPASETFTVGWIGSPATQGYLSPLSGMLSQALDVAGSRFVTIGSSFGRKLFEPHEEWAWSEDGEAGQVSEFDVGIMPLPDGPFERGKCGYKLVQYMAAGIPVIASPVGANVDIVRHGENGFLAETREEWLGALLTLRQDRDLRQRMGEAGRRMVRERYCFAITGPKLAEWFVQIAAGQRLDGGRQAARGS